MFNLTRTINQTLFKYRLRFYLEKIGVSQSLCTTKSSMQFEEEEEPKLNFRRRRLKEEKPVDWLPFEWKRRELFNIYEASGDKKRHIRVDPTLPKPGFELSDELKTASESVKHMFSVATGSVAEVKEVHRRELVKRVQRHPLDFRSLEVQIAERTVQVRSLFDHYAKNSRKETRIGRVVLAQMIQKRNKLLKILRRIDNDRFLWLLEELNLYYNPQPLMPVKERYTKKADLRRLTKEYCQKTIADKKEAYHESLKKEQESFETEKKETLAWIEEEEKAVELLKQKVSKIVI